MESPDAPRDSATPIAQQLDQIAGDVRRLEALVDELTARLGREIRTSRLVVVDDDGFERIVASASQLGGSVRVNAQPLFGRQSSVELFATEDVEPASFGVSLVVLGDCEAAFEIQPSDGRAHIWRRGESDWAPTWRQF